MTVVAALIDVPPRYLVPYASLLVGIVPVGLERAIQTLLPIRLSKWGKPSGALVVVCSAIWLIYAGPQERRRIRPLTNYTQLQQVQGRLMQSIKQYVAPEDRVLDCFNNLRVEVALMPFVHEADPAAVRESPSDVRCRAWASHPPAGKGNSWLVTGNNGYLSSWMSRNWKRVVAIRLPEQQGYLWKWEQPVEADGMNTQ
jgi:hypothetical protein